MRSSNIATKLVSVNAKFAVRLARRRLARDSVGLCRELARGCKRWQAQKYMYLFVSSRRILESPMPCCGPRPGSHCFS
ncbi:hypothetical protein QC761_708588 [Podospora bellae-mahoneyi]|uniref:Uncharacterized protein n=1 Tax=Podospora bellae-mahoneyi TaxID=2093777 RepID=A0ABR0F6Z8_9PEZI|nr:hypothetical protein QC761_708588 [Podospora bellae-mahoneyi]